MFQPPLEGQCNCYTKGARTVLLALGDGTAVGLCGLHEIFAHFHSQGKGLAPQLGEELLAAVKVHNYVPDCAAGLYKAALVREYEAYCAKHASRAPAR